MYPFYNQQQQIFYQNIQHLNQYYAIPANSYQYYQHLNSQPQNNIMQIQNIIPIQESNKINIPLNQNIATSDSTNLSSKQYFCKCMNTDCKKEYCVCFKYGQVCGTKCGCSNCRNKEIDHTTIAITKTKNISCNCKKSQCAKKYCECYANGIKCKLACHCAGCKNC